MAINENGISDCGTSVCRSTPAALSAEMLTVLETARELGRWVLICNDPPPSHLLERIYEAEDLADRLLGSADGKGGE